MPVASAETQSLALAYLGTPACRDDWPAFYDLLHREPPVYLGPDQWLLAGGDAVLAAMRSDGAELPALYPASDSTAINELLLGMLPFEAGASHRRLRSLAQPLFSARSISRLRPQVLELLEAILYPAVFEDGGCDIVGTLGVRVPEAISCLLLDVAAADRGEVGSWSRPIYNQIREPGPATELREAEAAQEALADYIERRLRGEAPFELAGGVGEALIAARRRGELDDGQLRSYFATFLLTGIDTLTHAVGNSLWFLAGSPSVFAALRERPELAAVAFAETMRLWGPIRLCIRRIESEVKLEATTLPAGSLHAANRDRRRLERPHELVWERGPQEDLAFGVGPHGCLGTAVGRLVGRTLFETLAARCEWLEATPGPDSPSFVPSLPILGVEAVRLRAQPGNVQTGLDSGAV